MPGRSREARSTTTASVIDDVTQTRSPNVRTAQATTSSAVAVSSSRLARSASTGESSSGQVIATPPDRPGAARTPGCRTGSARHRGCPRGAAGPRRRRTGSSRERRAAHSSQRLLGCPGCPLGESLAGVALVGEPAHHALDVLGKFVGRHLVTAQLAAEAGVETEPAAEVHLEALDLVAVAVEDELALQADVC